MLRGALFGCAAWLAGVIRVSGGGVALFGCAAWLAGVIRVPGGGV